jgi:predicted phage terminase large subunit-like protein
MSKSRGQNSNEISFTPTKYQDQFLRGDKRYLGFVSGVGAGKTYAGIIRTFLNMEKWNPGEMGAIVAPTRQMVVNVIIPEMRDLGLLERWDHKSSYSDEPGLHAPNGSRALILSADNQKTIERLRGLNLAWAWVDERTAVDDRAKEILMQRLRTGNYRNLYETTTPKGKDATYDFYVGDIDAGKRTFDRATLYQTEDRLAIVGVPTDANPNLPEDYTDDMDNLPDEIRAQEVQGEFVEIGSGLLTKDMLQAVSKDVLDSKQLRFYIGVDLGVEADSTKARESDSDYWCAVIVAHHRRKGEAYLVDFNRRRGMSMSEGVNWLQSVVDGVPNPMINIEEVHAQRYFLQACKEAGLNVTGVSQTQTKEDRLIQMSVPFENGNIKLVNFKQPQDKTPDERWSDFLTEWLSFPEGRHDDILDATEIALRNVDLGGYYEAQSGSLYS